MNATIAYRVQTPKRVYGTIEATAGIITHADPALRQFMGARLDRFRIWMERKGGLVRRMEQPREKNEWQTRT